MMETNFEELGWEMKRKRVIYEQEEKCNKCGVSEWLGNRLSFEIDHKDGNKSNDARNNLEALCPNCHSITPTWRGRKNRKMLTSSIVEPTTDNRKKEGRNLREQPT